MISAFIKSTQFCHARRLLSPIVTFGDASRAFKMDSRLIPPIDTFGGRLCGNDSVGRFLFYSLPLNVSSRGNSILRPLINWNLGIRVPVSEAHFRKMV